MFGLAPVAARAEEHRHRRRPRPPRSAIPSVEQFRLPVPPITVGALTKMVVLRKAIADGTARPDEIADFEATSKERQETLDKALRRRGRGAGRRAASDKLFISGHVERALPGRQGGPRAWATAPRTSIPTTASTSAAA